MPITTASDIVAYTTKLGECFDYYTEALTADVLEDGYNKIVEARASLQSLLPSLASGASSASNANYDNFLTYLNAVRAVERNMTPPQSPSDLYNPAVFQAPSHKTAIDALYDMLKSTCTSLDAYFINTYGVKMKKYSFTGTPSPAWTDDFRALWRRAMSEELPVRLGVFTDTDAFSSDSKTWVLPTAVELRVVGVAGSPADLSFSGVFEKTPNAVSETITATLDSTRSTSTIQELASTTSPSTFVSLSGTPTLTGRQADDEVELWLSD